MAIFGIGSQWESNDMTEEFIRENKICMGWSIIQAPSLYRILKDIKISDIVFIKTYLFNQSPAQLRIIAIGIVTDDNLLPYIAESAQQNFKECINVHWLWRGNVITEVNDPYNVRANSLYEEFNPNIQKTIVNLITNN